MAEFWAFSRLLREECDESIELHKYCQIIAAKYLECEKNELRAQSAFEENIILTLDIGNLKSIYTTIFENDEAQDELNSLLTEYYEEHLKYTFAIDECEIEKLNSYDEMKHELEIRDSINMSQQLYLRKMKTAKKMDERNIVKKYRIQEQQYLDIQSECLKLEDSVNKLKAKAEKSRIRQQEQQKLILELVKGSIDLETVFAEQYPKKSQLILSQRLSQIKTSDQNNLKGGLSSRLLMDFTQFKMPSMNALPKIRQINRKDGLNRLLQQAEVIRKSMETSPIVLSNNFPTPKLPGILKAPQEYPKTTTEGSQKTVSFEVNFEKEVTSTVDETQDVRSSKIPYSTALSEMSIDSEMKECLIEKDTKKPEINIIENVIIKPADKIANNHAPPKKVDSKSTTKRKANHEDFDYSIGSPPKKEFSPSETSIKMVSKSFMDMFLDLSKETTTIPSPAFEPVKKAKKEVKDTPQAKNKQEIKEKPIEKKFEPPKQEKIIKTKAAKKKFDDFEDFFSGLAADDDSDTNDNQPGADMSFDFFDGNDEPGDADDDDDAGSDNFSFKL